MLDLQGYKFVSTLYEGAKSIIYQALKEPEKTLVVIKTSRAEYPTLQEISRLRHEYNILRSIDIPGVVKLVGLEDYRNSLALVLEEFGSRSIDNQMTAEQKIELSLFLKIGINITKALDALHQNHIIHKDIKPHNILVNFQTGETKIIDFSIASRLEKETPQPTTANLIEGSFSYMSPEQTGRMNRSIDYRTDFYSLGVTFYEMLTGRLPFVATDSMELVHCHIAKNPIPPHQLDPQIHPAISAIVVKLLAKTAEDRYQSATGIRADLEECLNQLETRGKIANFEPAQLDTQSQFILPQKLYGREREVSQLMATFDRVAVGSSEMMLVSGYSGIGKTAVVNEVHKPIVKSRGYFISGKFDQFQRSIPYAALSQAFGELMGQLLTEDSTQLTIWKEKLTIALGQNGKVIIDVIPQVEYIIGSQPEMPEVGPTESQNRFIRVFKQFIAVFTTEEHPLVVFLDDLQWADNASLKLIQQLITDSETHYCLFMGAYRDNEVSPTHPTIITIEEIKKAGAIVNNLVLGPLNRENIKELVADTLKERERSPELAELLFNKTQGNPFFLTQLFKTLHTEQLLSFNFTDKEWCWDIRQIQSLGIADFNVVELVARNIGQLPETTQYVLKLAACIGNRFNLDVLAIAGEQSLLATANQLWEALQAGLILPLSNAYKIAQGIEKNQEDILKGEDVRVSYKFLHDRVQQAAYSLIPESEKQVTHLKIGQLLLQKKEKQGLGENIFDIVNQLNIGVDLVTQKSEKEELAQLNLAAGQKAKAATAYQAAVEYLNVGLGLLPEQRWESYYELTRDLYLEAYEAEYLNTNFERAKQLSEIVLSQAKTVIEKVKVYELKIPFYVSQNKPEIAIDTTIQVLKILEVTLPKQSGKLKITVAFILNKLILGSKKIENLAYLPLMTDPYKLASMRILIAVIPAAFMANPMLFPLIVFKMVALSLRYGNSSLSAYGYVSYGMLLCGALSDLNSGYQFGKLAVTIVEQFNSRELKTKIDFLFNGFIRYWQEHIKKTVTPLLEAFKIGLETGDIEYSCYAICNHLIHRYWSGENLEFLEKDYTKYIKIMLKYEQYLVCGQTQLAQQFILNLLDRAADKTKLTGDDFDEDKNLITWKDTNNYTFIAYLYIFKSIIFYLFSNYSQAVQNSELTEQFKESLGSLMHSPEHNLYYSLSLLAHYLNVTKREQKKYLKKVTTNQKQMKKWVHHAPMNFQNKYDLVEAEKARVLGQELQAMKLYDRAIAEAKKQGFIHEEAIANERAAEFYLAQDQINIAKTYMTEAYYAYIRWGAKAKVKDLDDRYPQLIIRTIRSATETDTPITTTSLTGITHSTATTHSTTGIASQILDLNTVFKASLALSGELVIEKLLEKLLKISIENAGANMGIFLSKQDEQWVIEAMGQVNPAQQQDNTTVSVDVAVSSGQTLPLSLLNYVEQTKENLVLNNASTDGLFSKDAYIQEQQPKSVLCAPLIHQNKLTGLLYLENNEISGAFTQERLKVINLLASQISISVDNARLYTQLEDYSRTLESKVEQRTQQLSEKNEQLEDTLQELKLAQRQIVAQEKLASLGSLTAGIAHEIRNPLNFVNSLANLSQDLTQDIVEEIERQTEQLDSETVEFLSESLDYLKRNVSEIHQQGKRADSIITSMLMHARTGSSSHQPGELNFVVAEAVQLAHQSLRAKDAAFNIEFDTQYDDSIGEIVIAAADLGRAIINIVDNACYAARKKSLTHADETFVPTVQVITRNRDTEVEIFVRDNGNGIPTEIKEKIFNPFFTTKPTGEGTGLGLSICHDIIVGQHRGEIQVNTRDGEGTDITIVIPRQLPETDNPETEYQEDVEPQVPYFQSENQIPYFKD